MPADPRAVERVIDPTPVVEGAGVRLRRSIATATLDYLDPFLLLDNFESSDPALNQLWKICAHSLELMSEDSYVDCADRERVEWTDDSPPEAQK